MDNLNVNAHQKTKKMDNGSVSAAELATLSLARPGFGIGGGGYGYGVGAGHLPNLYLAEQNKEISRDLNHGNCAIHRNIDDGNFKSQMNLNDRLATQSAFIDSQNDITNEKIQRVKDTVSSANQLVKETVVASNQAVKDSVDLSQRRTDAEFASLSNRLCGIEKTMAEQAAITAKNHEISMLTMSKNKEISEIRRINDLSIYGGCRPCVQSNCSPCSTPS